MKKAIFLIIFLIITINLTCFADASFESEKKAISTAESIRDNFFSVIIKIGNIAVSIHNILITEKMQTLTFLIFGRAYSKTPEFLIAVLLWITFFASFWAILVKYSLLSKPIGALLSICFVEIYAHTISPLITLKNMLKTILFSILFILLISFVFVLIRQIKEIFFLRKYFKEKKIEEEKRIYEEKIKNIQ